MPIAIHASTLCGCARTAASSSVRAVPCSPRCMASAARWNSAWKFDGSCATTWAIEPDRLGSASSRCACAACMRSGRRVRRSHAGSIRVADSRPGRPASASPARARQCAAPAPGGEKGPAMPALRDNAATWPPTMLPPSTAGVRPQPEHRAWRASHAGCGRQRAVRGQGAGAAQPRGQLLQRDAQGRAHDGDAGADRGDGNHGDAHRGRGAAAGKPADQGTPPALTT